MKLIVNPHKIEIEKSPVNEKEINITKVEFEFSEEITQDYVKEAYFTLNGSTYKQIIQNNECDIPYEVLNKQGQVEIGVVAYLVENDEEIKRYNPSPVYISTLIGSLKEDFENSEPITPTDKEQIEQELLNISTQMDNLDIDAEKEEHKTTITITKKDGTTKEVEVLDGEKGDKGDKGDAGAIKFEIVQELPTTDIKEDTIYLVPYSIIIVQELPTTGQSHTIYIVESTNKRYVYESSQWIEISSDNKYIEYIYVNNQWEELGGISVDVDLSDYYTKQETNDLLDNKADVSDIPDLTNYVQNTDYATDSVGGVIKSSSTYGNGMSNGALYPIVYSYNDYQNKNVNTFIGKGTLENVITGKQLVNQTYVDNIVGDIESILETLDIGNGV